MTHPARLGRLCAAYLIATGLGATPAASADLTAWQEIVVLTIAKVRHAAEVCGYRENASAVASLLASASLTTEALTPAQPLSGAMHRQIEADRDSYRGDRDQACQDAWDRFGTDGAPGVRDMLTR